MTAKVVSTRDFYDFTTNHSIPLLGFKPGRTNMITVSVIDKQRNQVTADQPLAFVTALLPTDFPNLVLLQMIPPGWNPVTPCSARSCPIKFIGY